jgi:hypothetical protein
VIVRKIPETFFGSTILTKVHIRGVVRSVARSGCLMSQASSFGFFPSGRAPVLVPLRPSREHILIMRVPGARDWHGCLSSPFIWGFREHRKPIGYPCAFHLMLHPILAF